MVDVKLWIRTVKPPIYNSVLVPVLVGTAAAKADGHVVNWSVCVQLFAAAVLLLTWCNISNDVFDSMTGVDEKKDNSYVTVSGSFWGCLIVSKVFLVISIIMFRRLSVDRHDPRILGGVVVATALAYLYQGPPFRLSYKGVGEILTFFAFGPAGTPVFYYFQAPQSPVTPLLAACSILVGTTTALILFTSHFNQEESDRAAGKMSPVVRLGIGRAATVLRSAVALCYVCVLVLSAIGAIPRYAIATVPLSLPLARTMLVLVRDTDKPELLAPLRLHTAKWHLAFHVMLVLALVI